MTRSRATIIGVSAILLWSLLALLTVGTAPVPPFLLNTLCFAIGGGLGLIWLVATGTLGQLRGVPLTVYAFGTLGLFGYHALYFSALRMAPAAEAGLIAYLWPLFIVLLSGLLPGERLRALHLVGAAMAFAGAALLVMRGGGGFEAAALPGLGLAFLCAITWSVYSVASRAMRAVPSAAVVVYCLATAALSLVVHLYFETTLWPQQATGWLAVLGLGLGPVGLAFFTWDIGMKKGDIQLLGVASYAAPLLSTLALIGAGIAKASPILLLSAVLITAGALLAARASLSRRTNSVERA
ncbi:MAG: DMT family transporter [Cypionkella sp.]